MAAIDVLAMDERLPVATAPLALVGRSAAAIRLRADLDAAAAAACVLIEAEAGLDAAELALDLHTRRNAGRQAPFLAFDCGAAEPGFIECELFGRTRNTEGVPTDSEARPPRGADVEAVGPQSLVARAGAAAGTLFLADVAELSASAQGRLARIARDGEVSIDGARRRLDIRLVASLQVPLDAVVAEGRVARELHRHFARTRVAVPPLRQRAEDIPMLVEQMLATACAPDRRPPAVTHSAMTLLSAMPWPGNLEELRRAVDQLATTAAGRVIQLEDVLAHVRFDGSIATRPPSGTLRAARRDFEREYIALVLRSHRGDIAAAAHTLGMQRTNLYRKARQLGLRVARAVR